MLLLSVALESVFIWEKLKRYGKKKMEFSFISNFHGHICWLEELFIIYVYICGIGTWASIDFPQIVILVNNNISAKTDDKAFHGPCLYNHLLICQSPWSVMGPQGHCSLPLIVQYLTWEFVKEKKSLSTYWYFTIQQFYSFQMTRNIMPMQTRTRKLRAALFLIAKAWKEPSCPLVGERTNELWYIQTTKWY